MKLFSALLLVVQQFVVPPAAATWVQVGSDIDGENARDYAGGTEKGLAMNAEGTTIAVGSSGHDGSGGANSGHVRVFDFDGKGWMQRGLDINGEFADDNSGSSVVLSEDGMVVGIGEPNSEAGNTDRFEEDYGQVRVFEWIGGVWTQRGEPITGVDRYNFASSGGGLAMDASGATIVIGAATYDMNGFDGRNQGHVRVFDWDGTNWIQRGNDLIGEAPGDWFGESLDIDAAGNTVAVGAIFNDGDAEDGPISCVVCRGSVRIFDWNSAGAWLQRGNDIDGEEDYDYFGSSVALNGAGDVVAIGSPQTNAPVGHPKRGAVTVYEWNGGQWQKRGSRIKGEANGDISGANVAISNSGDTIAIGAYLNAGSSDTEGHVRVYDWSGNQWLQRGDDIDGENTYDYSGYSLDMTADGNTLASGARFTDDGAGYFAGHVRVFGWKEGNDDTDDNDTDDNDADDNDADNDETDDNDAENDDAEDDDGFETCYAADTQVNVQGRGLVPMKNLQVGDQVQTGGGKFQTLYAIDHFHPTRPTEFLQIHTAMTAVATGATFKPLELTALHMVFVAGKRNPIPAAQLEVGDIMVAPIACVNHVECHDGQDNQSDYGREYREITKIDSVIRNGFYNVLTADGTIVVNGLLGSTYPAFLGTEYMELGGKKIVSHQTFLHWALTPVRALCLGVSLEFCRIDSAYIHAADGHFAWYDKLANCFFQFWKQHSTMSAGDTYHNFMRLVVTTVVLLCCGASVFFNVALFESFAPYEDSVVCDDDSNCRKGRSNKHYQSLSQKSRHRKVQ